MPKANWQLPKSEPVNDVPKMFYNVKDVQKMLGCGYDYALTKLRFYYVYGQGCRLGDGKKAKYLVPRAIFDAEIRQQCGLDQFYKVPLKAINGGRR